MRHGLLRRAVMVAVAAGACGGTAAAASYITLRAGQETYYMGTVCKAARGGTMLCLRVDGRGYGVAVDTAYVRVFSASNRVVFMRRQP